MKTTIGDEERTVTIKIIMRGDKIVLIIDQPEWWDEPMEIEMTVEEWKYIVSHINSKIDGATQ